MNDAARWERTQALFHAALDLPEPQRLAFVARECAGDADLEREVLAMLEADARRDSLLERGVAEVAGRVLGATTPPLRIGPYRIVRLLGEGGMGVVYQGERDDLGSTAAIKILRDAWLSPARRERFLAERRTLAQLDHPSIARLYDADTLPDGTPWFVMERVDGVPITEHCATHTLGVRERLALFRAVCEAVQHAHGHAIIHRDIKPSNILVRPDGAVKLLDFGIAKQLDSLDVRADRTRTGLRLMTPAYAAPEQLRGAPIGTYTDVHALGVLLYELLAGRPPHDLAQLSASEAERTILESEPARPSSHESRAPGADRREWADLDILCLTAMQQEPARRYPTVYALLRDVDHFLAGEPLDARPDGAAYRIGKFARRHRGRISAVAAGLVLVIGLAGFYTVRLAAARDEAVAEAARTQRIQAFMLSMFQGGDEAGPPDSLRVLALLERGAREARSLDGEPAVEAELYATLGDLYAKLGRLDAADTLLQAALELRQTLAGDAAAESGDVADRLVALGLLRAEQASLEDAERLVREGLEMAQRTRPEHHPAVAAATGALGQVLVHRGDYDGAVRVLEEAVRLREPAGPSPELAGALTELGGAHFYAGRYAVSDSVVRRVLTMNRTLYGDNHPHVADEMITLGAIQFELGRYDEAERGYREALAIKEAWYGPDHPAVASNLTMLGRALVYQERHDEAVALLERSLSIQQRAYGDAHPRVASAVNELGNIALGRGRYDEAESHFTRMLGIYRAVYGEGHYLLGIALSNLGSVHSARGDYTEAERIFRAAVRRFTETLSPGHTQTGIARLKLGRALLRQGRHREAIAESLAGYEILSAQTEPATSFLRAAREDLAAAYDAIGQPEQADRFR